MLIIGVTSVIAGVVFAIVAITLLLFAQVTFWQLGFLAIVLGYYPFGKTLFRTVNELKKGKPTGFVLHKLELLGEHYLGYRPSYNRHRGAWEIRRL
jgi:conjugative transfer region protein (TIGR03750 family)